MQADVDISVPARLMGEPARAAMLAALLSGQALAAGELARAAGVSAATASEHLARLRDGGLVDVVPAGRHRYYRLASPEVARAIEAIAAVSPARPVRSAPRTVHPAQCSRTVQPREAPAQGSRRRE